MRRHGKEGKAMLPEDRLDALLALRVGARRGRNEQPSANGSGHGGDLQPLLDAADRVATFGDEEPSQAFAARLEALFLARAADLRERNGFVSQPLLSDATPLPLIETPPLIGNDDPTLPGIEWSAASNDATLPDIPSVGRPIAARRQPAWRRLLWPALAATLLFAIGMTTFTAAALAGPGSPLYGLHKWEQNIQANLTGSAADRTQLHISNAQDALFALNTAVANHQTGAAYDDALATFRDEARAAATSLGSVLNGGERDTLTDQLDQLHAIGIANLHTALPDLSWSQRIETTGVLAE